MASNEEDAIAENLSLRRLLLAVAPDVPPLDDPPPEADPQDEAAPQDPPPETAPALMCTTFLSSAVSSLPAVEPAVMTMRDVLPNHIAAKWKHDPLADRSVLAADIYRRANEVAAGITALTALNSWFAEIGVPIQSQLSHAITSATGLLDADQIVELRAINRHANSAKHSF